jgi:F-type H+-transporting ATPase subunit delta
VAKRAYPRRYAQAVFEIALDKSELDKWAADLQKIGSLQEDVSLVAWLESPKFPFEDKIRLLATQLGDVNPMVLNLVYLLVAKESLGMVGDIYDEYQRLVDNYHGLEHAEVTTAVPLDDKDAQRLSERLGTLVGKKVVLKTKVAPQLLGGIVARIGGKLLDGSTRSRLLSLKKEIQG